MSDPLPSREQLQARLERAEARIRDFEQSTSPADAQRRTASALDTVSEGFIIVDRDGRITFANTAAERFTLMTRDQLLGKTLEELFPEASHCLFGSEYRRAVVEAVPVHFEEYYPEPLNKWYEVRAYPSAEGMSIFFRDITERRRTQEALRVNLTKYSVLFDAFPLGIAVTDSQGHFLEVNRAAVRLLGLPDGEIMRRRIDSPDWRIIRPDGSPMPPQELAGGRALAERRLVENVETGVVRPDGQVSWFSVSAAPLPLDGYGVVITFGDISARKQADEQLKQAHGEAVAARARLEAVMEAMPTGLAIIDAEGGNIRSNAAFERIWGPGRPTTRNIGDYAAYKAWWLDTGREVQPEEWASAQALQKGETVTGQAMEIQRFDGGHAFVLNSAAPILDANGQPAGCAVAIHDMTRRIEAQRALARSEKALQRLNQELEAANAALQRSNETLEAHVTERTAALSHRTIQLQRLARDLTHAEERERQRVAQVIHDDLQQLLSLARMNLGIALAQLETGSTSIQKIVGEVDDLIARSLDVTRSLTAELSPAILRRSGLTAALLWLARWYEDRFALHVLVEAEKDADVDPETRVTLFRSVRELLFNVVKHSGVTSARVRLKHEAGGRVCIVVSDEGAGFEPAALERHDGANGGFGLRNLRERLELLGGRLEVDSGPGRGASVTLVGPLPQQSGLAAPMSGTGSISPRVGVQKRSGAPNAPRRRKRR